MAHGPTVSLLSELWRLRPSSIEGAALRPHLWGLLLMQTHLVGAEGRHDTLHLTQALRKPWWLTSSLRCCCHPHFTEYDAASVKLFSTRWTRPAALLVTLSVAPTPQILLAKVGSSLQLLEKKHSTVLGISVLLVHVPQEGKETREKNNLRTAFLFPLSAFCLLSVCVFCARA